MGARAVGAVKPLQREISDANAALPARRLPPRSVPAWPVGFSRQRARSSAS